jgi:hypothetical protein
VASTPVQPTPIWISLREAGELVRQKYLSPARTGQLLVEWLHAKLVRWRYVEIQNNSGISTETVLSEFWQPAGLATDWEGSWTARKVEPRAAAARGGVLPGG